MNTQYPFDDMPVIYSYTRKQAIDDGVLVDLTKWARETGFTIPVACTAAVWHQYIVPPEAVNGFGQSVRGPAHDMLWMLWVAIKRSQSGDRLMFDVIFLQTPGEHVTVTLKSICGPGDDAEPVITILLPNED